MWYAPAFDPFEGYYNGTRQKRTGNNTNNSEGYY